MFQYPTNKVPSEKRPIQFKAVDRNVPMHKIGLCSVLSNFPKKETFDLKMKKKQQLALRNEQRTIENPHTRTGEKITKSD